MIETLEHGLAKICGSCLIVPGTTLYLVFTVLLLELVQGPQVDFFVISDTRKNAVSTKRMIVSKADAPNESLMCINLKHRLSLWQVPEDDLAVSTGRYHISQIISVLSEAIDSVRMRVHGVQERFGKDFLKFGSVQSSLIFASLLERMQIRISWIPEHFLQRVVRLLLISFFVPTYSFDLYHLLGVFFLYLK